MAEVQVINDEAKVCFTKGMPTVRKYIVCILVGHEIRANNMFQYLAHDTSKRYRSVVDREKSVAFLVHTC